MHGPDAQGLYSMGAAERWFAADAHIHLYILQQTRLCLR